MEYTGKVTVNVVKNDGEFLLAERSEETSTPGYWEFVGGKVEENETIEEAAVRELKEETGLEGEVLRLGDTYPSSVDSKWELVPVLMKSDSRDVEIGREHSDYEWIKLEDIEDFKTLGQKESLEKLDLL